MRDPGRRSNHARRLRLRYGSWAFLAVTAVLNACAGPETAPPVTGSPDVGPGPQVVDFATLLCRNDPIACRPIVLPVSSIDDARNAEEPEAAVPVPSYPDLPLVQRPVTAPALILGTGERVSPD